MIKAIFFDIDGTLLDHDTHLMPSSTFEALKKLRKNGIRLFVATGRPPNNLKVIQDCFEFDGFLTSNGQYCFNQWLFMKNILKEKILEIHYHILTKIRFPYYL